MLDEVQQRHLLAASGYTELGLFQEAVDEMEAIAQEVQQTVPVLAGWTDLYQSWQKWEEARTVAELSQHVDLAEMEEALLHGRSAAFVLQVRRAARRARRRPVRRLRRRDRSPARRIPASRQRWQL